MGDAKLNRMILVLIALTPPLVSGCGAAPSMPVKRMADPEASYTSHDLSFHQELVNDAPIGTGETQPSNHCPTGPGTWFAGSGRSTATSNVFGDLTGTEVYCVNVDRSELSGGLATWTDVDGDTISVTFGVKLLEGFAYAEAPSAPMIGYAQFTGGTGKWSGLCGDALMTGVQNGDGTASLDYQGTIYRPR